MLDTQESGGASSPTLLDLFSYRKFDVTEDEHAAQFEKCRQYTINITRWRYPYIEHDTLDMLYTDCWYSLKGATFQLDNMKSYLTATLANRVKDFIRDRSRSEDVFERFTRADQSGDDEPYNDFQWLYNLPDTREAEAMHHEEVIYLVNAIMAKLPRTLALVGEWYYIDEQTQDEIACTLQCSQQNVQLMLMRFRSKFKELYLMLTREDSALCPTHL